MGHAALQRFKLMNESDEHWDSFAIREEILKLMDEFREQQ
jgi:hypothetical protein